MDSMRNQISNTIGALQSLLQKLQDVQYQAQATIAAVQAAAAISAANGYNSGISGDYGNYGNDGGTQTTGGGPYKTYSTPPNDDPFKVKQDGKHAAYKVVGDNGQVYGTYNNYSQAYAKAALYDADLYRNNQFMAHLATGGYTGAWGNEGRLAILHEKELVLNKEDTANMLTAVNVVRGMMDSIAGNDMMNSLALAAGGVTGSFGSMLDQNVHIEANFPNVQSHTEIEMAINNLINSASQYVNRKS